MWIARDESGEVYLYELRPKRGLHVFTSCTGENICAYLGGKEVYPELTWENSPKQVELKLMDK